MDDDGKLTRARVVMRQAAVNLEKLAQSSGITCAFSDRLDEIALKLREASKEQ